MITYSNASKYSEIFEILSDPYALMITSFLFENEGAFTAEELARTIKTTDDKVTDICESLCDLEVFEADRDAPEAKYFLADYHYGNVVEDIIRRID